LVWGVICVCWKGKCWDLEIAVGSFVYLRNGSNVFETYIKLFRGGVRGNVLIYTVCTKT